MALQRSSLRRTGTLRRSRHLRSVGDIEIANKQAFRQAATSQRACAVCGKIASYEAHHVVAKAKLKREGFLSADCFDTRNALRVCDERAGNCHNRHTTASTRIPLSALTDDNIDYAFQVLGARAYYYLHSQYGGDEPRVEAAFKEETGNAP